MEDGRRKEQLRDEYRHCVSSIKILKHVAGLLELGGQHQIKSITHS